MNKKALIYSLLLGCNVLSFCDNATANSEKKDFWVTIFLHGSFSLKPHLNISNLLNMLNDSIEETIYYRATEINRRDPFFYKNQAMGDIGLQKINIHRPTNITAAPTVAIAFEQISQLANNKPSDEYYMFGWSGLVSNKLRYIEASFLYHELTKLLNEFKEKGLKPKLRLIGYSHGGNLGMQLGAIHQTKHQNDQLLVDEFHLLGTPIQIETDYLINSPIFKRVYNWYSQSDNIQSLDCFSFKRFFSRKKFYKRKNFTPSDKLTQIKVKVSGHTPKKLKKQLDRKPENKKEVKKYFKEHCYDPGHFELWFMGWTLLTYRQKFPTNPLPIMVFVPLITKYINEEPELAQDLIVHIQPAIDTVDLFAYKNKKKSFATSKPFVDDAVLDEMKNYAFKFMPENYNAETYNRKVYDAIRIVQHELNTIEKIIRHEKKQNPQNHKTINLHKPSKKYHGHLPGDMA